MTELEEIKKALEAAEQFIVNGVELGHIRMPNPETPDSAHDTLPMIRQAQTALESLQAKNEGLLKRAATAETRLRGANTAFERERKLHLKNQELNRKLETRAEAAEDEVKRLQAEIDRKSSMPGDHRYWEGRYRDEAAQKETLREALKPFVSAFERRRESYSKRYPTDRELGYANFDKMPDDWAMEKLSFNMLAYRRARQALASTGGEHHGN